MPTTATMMATTKRTRSTRRARLRSRSWSCGSSAGGSRARASAIMTTFVFDPVVPVDDAENDRYEKQRCESREQQAPDDRAAQRRVLLAALAKPQRHWHHADDHR